MNDTIFVAELLRRFRASGDPSLFDSLFVLYIHRYRQVMSNTVHFTVPEKVPHTLALAENAN